MMFLPTQCGTFMAVVVIVRHFSIIEVDYATLSRFLMFICGLGLLFVVGVLDDLMGINYRWKFVAQIIAASFLPVSGLWIYSLDGLFGITDFPSWVGIPFTLLVTVFIINAFNMIDGMDGLCSGLTVLACSVLGTLFLRQGAWLFAIFSMITIGAMAPFFYYNVFGKSKRRRRIFMGDTGSMTLGLTLSFLAISCAAGPPDGRPSITGNILVAFSVVALPMLDVLRVMGLRLLSSRPVFLPDKNHIHHYFLSMGFQKHGALAYILLLSLVFIVFNMVGMRYLNINTMLVLNAALWLTMMWLGKTLKRGRLQKQLRNEN
jgi:UDP-N-acetylmuramyl pentapeptide phosphotransferase/UDP-N-acetylglucosamine-1-phosphate transferase